MRALYFSFLEWEWRHGRLHQRHDCRGGTSWGFWERPQEFSRHVPDSNRRLFSGHFGEFFPPFFFSKTKKKTISIFSPGCCSHERFSRSLHGPSRSAPGSALQGADRAQQSAEPERSFCEEDVWERQSAGAHAVQSPGEHFPYQYETFIKKLSFLSENERIHLKCSITIFQLCIKQKPLK